jgi:hypothetical protein
VGSFGEVLVLDWGVATVLARTPALTREFAWEARFMAPEQHAGDSSAREQAAEVYSLGALLASMLGSAPSTRRLRAVIDKCKADRPADRYADCGELVDELRRGTAPDSR